MEPAALASAGTAAPAPGAVLPGFGWALARDLKLALRSRAELGVQVLFYVIVVSLFPLSTSPERNLLATMGPGVLWVAALLASLLSLLAAVRVRLGRRHAGADRAVAVSAARPIVGGKIAAHWLTTGLPVVLLAPLLGIQYSLDGESILVLMAGLLLGTPILSLLGAIGAALTLGLRQRRRQPARAADPAALRAGADLRRRRRRRGARRTRRHRQPFAAGRGTARRHRRRAVRGRGSGAHRPRLNPSR